MRKGLLIPAIVVPIAVGVLATSCGGGEGEPAAEEEQVAAADTQREPKNLEARVTIVMGDDLPQMYFADSDGKRGGPFTIPVGKTVGIRVINRGELEHEIMIGRKFDATAGEHGAEENLFASLPADIFVFKPVKMEIEEAVFGEIELEPQGELWIRTVFPPEMKGEWEIGCLLEGHREAGMTASLTVG